VLDIELAELKRQRKAAKREMLRCTLHTDKEMYESLESNQRQLLSDMAGKKRPSHRHGESDPHTSEARMNRSMEIREAESRSLDTSQDLDSPTRVRAASMTKQT